MRQEAEEAFGGKEAEPSRHAAEQMLVTVSSLKVCSPGQSILKGLQSMLCWPYLGPLSSLPHTSTLDT